jgi:hypothetical protein
MVAIYTEYARTGIFMSKKLGSKYSAREASDLGTRVAQLLVDAYAQIR